MVCPGFAVSFAKEMANGSEYHWLAISDDSWVLVKRRQCAMTDYAPNKYKKRSFAPAVVALFVVILLAMSYVLRGGSRRGKGRGRTRNHHWQYLPRLLRQSSSE